MFKQYLALLVGKLLDQIGTDEVVATWETIVHGMQRDWGFNPDCAQSYDLAHNFGSLAVGLYRVDRAITVDLKTDYYDLYVQRGQIKWGYEVYEGTGHLYRLDTTLSTTPPQTHDIRRWAVRPYR